MSSNPIQSGFVPANPDYSPWFDEVNDLLRGYQVAVDSQSNPNDSSISAAVKVAVVRGFERDLARYGVTVCGGFGHA